MAARPPGGGGTADPEAIEFGIAVLNERLEEADVSFPATVDEIVAAVDDDKIPYDAKGRTIALSEALAQVPQTEFENETEFLDVLYPVFDQRRREGGSFFARLRDALPF